VRLSADPFFASLPPRSEPSNRRLYNFPERSSRLLADRYTTYCYTKYRGWRRCYRELESTKTRGFRGVRDPFAALENCLEIVSVVEEYRLVAVVVDVEKEFS
jgi:hypothetical protein